jgi:hypothetical protein
MQDDAGMAFREDGARFACAAGQGAKLWDTATGRELNSWRLPRGTRDQLTFHPSGALLLFRAEANSLEGGRPSDAAQVGRLRNLLGQEPVRPLAELRAFNRHLLGAAFTPYGRTLLVEGIGAGPDGQRRTVTAYDGLTGAQRWSLSSTCSRLEESLALAPTGRLAVVRTDNREEMGVLADVSSGDVLETVQPFPICLDPQAQTLVRPGTGAAPGEERGYALYWRHGSVPYITLGIVTPPSFRPVFSRNGDLLAWSNADGTISICDLRGLRQRLAEVGLDW